MTSCVKYVLQLLSPTWYPVKTNSKLIIYFMYTAQCEELEVGKVVAIHNARAKVINKHLTLGFDKWSSVRSTTIAIPGEELRDPNFSDHVYNAVVE